MNTIQANDFLNQPLEIGDKVAAVEIGYRNLVKCDVIKITTQYLFLKINDENDSKVGKEFKQKHSQVIKYN